VDLVWTPRARQHLLNVSAYIARDNPTAAMQRSTGSGTPSPTWPYTRPWDVWGVSLGRGSRLSPGHHTSSRTVYASDQYASLPCCTRRSDGRASCNYCLCPAHGLDHAPRPTTGRAWRGPVTAAAAAVIGTDLLTCPRRACWCFVARAHPCRPAGLRVLSLRLLVVPLVSAIHRILLASALVGTSLSISGALSRYRMLLLQPVCQRASGGV
jgi:hypothetical protein